MPARFGKLRIMERTGQDSSRLRERAVETAAVTPGRFVVKGVADDSCTYGAQGARAIGVAIESEAPRSDGSDGTWDDYPVGDKAWVVENTDQPVLVESDAAAGTFSDGDKVTTDATGKADAAVTADNVNGIVIEEVVAPDGTVYVRIQPTWHGSEVVA